MDLFELVTGHKGLSSDKTQRILILSLREDRWRGLIRRFFHYPATGMLADGLTKTGTFGELLRFATTGVVRVQLQQDKMIRTAKPQQGGQYDENTLRDLEPV